MCGNIYHHSFLLLLFEVKVPSRMRMRSASIAMQTYKLALQSQAFLKVASASALQCLFRMLG